MPSRDVQQYYEFWHEINQVYADWARAHGVSMHMLIVLEALWSQKDQGCTLRGLQDQLHLPKQTIHTILDGLVDAGYVERSPAPGDKRTRVLRLTARGQAYAAEQVGPMYRWEEHAMAQLDPHDRTIMLQTYRQLIDALREGWKGETGS